MSFECFLILKSKKKKKKKKLKKIYRYKIPIFLEDVNIENEIF